MLKQFLDSDIWTSPPCICGNLKHQTVWTHKMYFWIVLRWKKFALFCLMRRRFVSGFLIKYAKREYFFLHKTGINSFVTISTVWQNCLKISVWEDLEKIKHSRSGPLVVTVAAALSQYLSNFLLHLLLHHLPLKWNFPQKHTHFWPEFASFVPNSNPRSFVNQLMTICNWPSKKNPQTILHPWCNHSLWKTRINLD